LFSRAAGAVRGHPRHQHAAGLMAVLRVARSPEKMHLMAQARLGPGVDLAARRQLYRLGLQPRRRQPRTPPRYTFHAVGTEKRQWISPGATPRSTPGQKR